MNAASWLEGIPAPEKWRTLLLAHGPRIATWTLAVLLAVQAAVILTGLGGASRAPATGANPIVAIPRHSVDIAAIDNAHLFGTAAVAQSAGDPRNAPQSTIPLVLTGIISAEDPQTGLAILGQTAATSKVFAVGDNLPGSAKLHSVYSDRVVIDRGGRLETLVLPRQAAPGGAPPSAAVLNTESPVADRMRKLITEQPSLLADVMRPQPVFANGKQTGFRVYPGRNRQAFVRLGLRPGDLVTAINGTPLDDPERGQEIFRTLGSSPDARVSVTRNGQQQDLTLNLAQITQEAESIAAAPPGGAAGDQAQPSPPGTGPAADQPKPPE
ncbi:MAG TPA: type II secretion system protein GspC [Steroidobacteraceae bacterium]